MGIDDRKQQVLRAIVRLYGTGGEPVGSTLLAQHFSMPISSATLRNEMAALTRLGLLEQPHTSAGRVPSAKGYRYYFDNLLDEGNALGKRECSLIDNAFAAMDYDPERLTENAAAALADMTGYSVVATTPRSADAYIAHFEVLQVGRSAAAVLAVTNASSVRTRTAKVATPLQGGDAARLARVLNEGLAFRSAADVSEAWLRQLALSLGADGMALYPVITAAYKLLCEAGRAKVFIAGEQNLLGYQELADSFRALMALFGDEHALQVYLTPDSEHTEILLGDDLEAYPMPGFSIVSTQYVAGGGRKGAMGVIGPTRMPYREVIPRLKYFARKLGESITGAKEEQAHE